MRAKNNRIREGNGRKFQGRRKGKEKSCFVVVQFELIVGHPVMSSVDALSSLVRLVTALRGANFWSCVICEKMMVYRVVSYDIGERRSVQNEKNRPQF